MRNQARAMVLVQEPFYRHDSLGPGAPLRQITGVSEQAGYYDWAGRRLFLADGEPDPMCPGAYRYQHNPDCCDLEAPDSDPRSPRYEPMHLRHKVGDTWIIDANRPYDPFDPGPYGSRGWYKDERTGRHRRDETPDPLPAEGWVTPKGAWFPGTADWPEPEAPQDESTRPAGGEGGVGSGGSGRGDGDRGRGSGGRGGDRQRGAGERGGSDRPPPWGARGRPVPSEPDEPEGRHGFGCGPAGRPGPDPDGARHTRQFWSRAESGSGPGDAGWISGYGARQSESGTSIGSEGGDGSQGATAGAQQSGESGWGGREDDRRSGAETTGEYRFSKLREDAFDRFMVQSAQLRAAHFQPEKPYLRERVVWGLRWLLWVFALGLASMPAPLRSDQNRTDSTAVHAVPTQRRAESRVSAAGPGETSEVRSEGSRSVTDRPRPSAPDPMGAEPAHRPGAAIAAAVGGARAARKVIAARESRTEHDLARAVRNSAARRPSPRPYMATWEHAFDANATFILGGAA
jgi:hypothetical protein